MKKGYQFDYSSLRPQMFDAKSRLKKAERILKTLSDYYGKNSLKSLKLLDVGASTGIIDNYLSKHFEYVYGLDIDDQAIDFARKNFRRPNLKFLVADALNLKYPANNLDVVVCTHVYEHVTNPSKLFRQIYKVLKPGGVCYLAAINSLWPIEPHYDLPFLSYLPKKLGNIYVRIFKKAKDYYETPLNYWQLELLTKRFKKIDYTERILRNPVKYGYGDKFPDQINLFTRIFAPILKYLTPTFFWLLIKNG